MGNLLYLCSVKLHKKAQICKFLYVFLAKNVIKHILNIYTKNKNNYYLYLYEYYFGTHFDMGGSTETNYKQYNYENKNYLCFVPD